MAPSGRRSGCGAACLDDSVDVDAGAGFDEELVAREQRTGDRQGTVAGLNHVVGPQNAEDRIRCALCRCRDEGLVRSQIGRAAEPAECLDKALVAGVEGDIAGAETEHL
ncbi:hypothetical protein [Mycobacterium sp. EPa45]|uniref:hypothetical protein n=1 Tax=Mycobacterium sp. EPa45 TaxID=1545728 RepID=UPI00118736DD|nr:hypothetical protein [Mycobacterium sp. EPa45]